MILAQLLVQFAFRVTFGLSAALAVVPYRMVAGGFFRVHLWVLMGINTLAALVLFTRRPQFEEFLPRSNLVTGLAVALAAISYLGSVIWLYERRELGRLALGLIAALSLCAALWATPRGGTPSAAALLEAADLVSSGLLLGTTLSAMFLGHWYLNNPDMRLTPLKRLLVLIAVALLLRALVSGSGLALRARVASG